LGNRLQSANYPPVGAGRHEYDKVHNYVLIVNDFSAIRNSQLIFSGVMEFHDIALRGIEDRFKPVILIQILASKTGALLAENGVAQYLLGVTSESPLEGIQAVDVKGLRKTGPGEAIISQDSALR
jgi:hypothetical protein